METGRFNKMADGVPVYNIQLGLLDMTVDKFCFPVKGCRRLCWTAS